MRFLLPTKEYNLDALKDQYNWEMISADNDYYVLLPDDISQSELDAIIQIANDHDPSPTPEQAAILVRKLLSSESLTLKLSLPIIREMNNAAQTVLIDTFAYHLLNNIPIEDFDPVEFNASVYAVWRPIFESLDSDIRYRFMAYHAIHDGNFSFYPEPEIPDIEYMSSFNKAISGTDIYMAILGLM